MDNQVGKNPKQEAVRQWTPESSWIFGYKWIIKLGKVQNRKLSGSELLNAAGFLDINGELSQEKSKTGSGQAVTA